MPIFGLIQEGFPYTGGVMAVKRKENCFILPQGYSYVTDSLDLKSYD